MVVDPQTVEERFSDSCTVVRVVSKRWIQPVYETATLTLAAQIFYRWGMAKSQQSDAMPAGPFFEPLQDFDYAETKWLYLRSKMRELQVPTLGTNTVYTGTFTKVPNQFQVPARDVGVCCAPDILNGTTVPLTGGCDECPEDAYNINYPGEVDSISLTSSATPTLTGQLKFPLTQLSLSWRGRVRLTENDILSVFCSGTAVNSCSADAPVTWRHFTEMKVLLEY